MGWAGICLAHVTFILLACIMMKLCQPYAGLLGQSWAGDGVLAPQWVFTAYFVVLQCMVRLLSGSLCIVQHIIVDTQTRQKPKKIV